MIVLVGKAWKGHYLLICVWSELKRHKLRSTGHLPAYNGLYGSIEKKSILVKRTDHSVVQSYTTNLPKRELMNNDIESVTEDQISLRN